jgi:hypothetical protein
MVLTGLNLPLEVEGNIVILFINPEKDRWGRATPGILLSGFLEGLKVFLQASPLFFRNSSLFVGSGRS